MGGGGGDQTDGGGGSQALPVEADMMIAYATVPGGCGHIRGVVIYMAIFHGFQIKPFLTRNAINVC